MSNPKVLSLGLGLILVADFLTFVPGAAFVAIVLAGLGLILTLITFRKWRTLSWQLTLTAGLLLSASGVFTAQNAPALGAGADIFQLFQGIGFVVLVVTLIPFVSRRRHSSPSTKRTPTAP
jgi:hypothetical protein